jgi:hypothetical protein
MANDLTKNPLIVDSATSNALIPTTQTIVIERIRWHDAGGSAGDRAVVQDGFGNLLWNTTASGSNYEEVEDMTWLQKKTRTLHGLLVPTLSSGTLNIYITG